MERVREEEKSSETRKSQKKEDAGARGGEKRESLSVPKRSWERSRNRPKKIPKYRNTFPYSFETRQKDLNIKIVLINNNFLGSFH